MRWQLAISILLVAASPVHAQVPGLSNAQVTDQSSISSPAGIKPEAGGGWLAQSGNESDIAALTELLVR